MSMRFYVRISGRYARQISALCQILLLAVVWAAAMVISAAIDRLGASRWVGLVALTLFACAGSAIVSAEWRAAVRRGDEEHDDEPFLDASSDASGDASDERPDVGPVRPTEFLVPACAHCGDRPASCVGAYDQEAEAPACDQCCGHGCEDGRCRPLQSSDWRPAPGVVPDRATEDNQDGKA